MNEHNILNICEENMGKNNLFREISLEAKAV